MAVLREAHRAGASGLDLARRNATEMDEDLTRLIRGSGAAPPAGLAILALGSYGRMELCPQSDLDLLFLHASDEPAGEGLVRFLLYFLWDVGLEVGHAVRKVEECAEVASKDSRTRTALLDHRLVFGDPDLVERLRRTLREEVFRDPLAFVREKMGDMHSAWSKYGDSVYLLEPHVKDGVGGLRDLHVLEWAAKAFRPFAGLAEQQSDVIAPAELDRIRRAQAFMLRVRNDLHFETGRRNDRLTFDQQERIGRAFGYADTPQRLGVESFMRDYYLEAREIQFLTERILHRIVDRLSPPGVERPEAVHPRGLITGEKFRVRWEAEGATPVAILEAFRAAAEADVEVDPASLAEVQGAVAGFSNDAQRRDEAWPAFLALMEAGPGLGPVLLQMNESGFFGWLIPEFGRLRCQVQHNAYHIYTTDVHTLRAVWEWKQLRHGRYQREMPMLTRLARALKNDLVLTLGLLFHDILKGSGKDHSHRGAAVAREIAERMALKAEEIDTLVFLVEQHLLLSTAAYKRDSDDPDFIRRLAERIQTEERVTLLYLLTVCDTRAVGPGTWTQWKATLLQELFIKVAEVINPTDYRDERQRLNERVEEIVRRASAKLPAEVARAELAVLPPSYVLSNPPWKVARHVQILHQIRDKTFVATLRRLQKRPLLELLIATRDKPALLSRHAGTLTSYGLNILKVQLNTTADGRVLDLYHVEDTSGRLYDELERWEELKADLQKAWSGELQVQELVEKRLSQGAGRDRYLPRVKPQVLIDNEISLKDTVVEVIAQDRMGLLYSLARKLAELNTTIRLAKVNTEGEKAIDVFYVQDVAGGKIESADRIERMRHELLDMLAA